MPAWAAPAPPSKQGAGNIVVVVVASLAAVVLIVGAIVTYGSSSRGGPDHPDQWDARVVDLVGFVESYGGAPFVHPVYVDFVPEEEFKQEAGGGNQPLTDEERASADRSAAMFRALGLISGDIDLAAEQQDLHAEGTAAAYQPSTKRIRVRGTELDLATKGTLVHELTHAWQDQQFDLNRIEDMASSEERTAFRSVAEGHAVNAEDAWTEQLSTADRATYEEQQHKQGSAAQEKISDIPGVLVAAFDAPYEFGPPFVNFMKERDGSAGIRRAFTKPPTSAEQLMDPWRFVDPGPEVSQPELALDGKTKVEDGQFGALFWYLLFADRIDPHVAMKAADGWGNDAYALYEQDGRVCVTARFKGDTGPDVDEFAAAATEWAGTLPPEAGATVASKDGVVDVNSCDPGTGVAFDVPDRAERVIGIPVVRSLAWTSSLEAGADDTEARCFGDAFAAGLTVDDLSGTGPIPDERIAELRTNARAAC